MISGCCKVYSNAKGEREREKRKVHVYSAHKAKPEGYYLRETLSTAARQNKSARVYIYNTPARAPIVYTLFEAAAAAAAFLVYIMHS